MIAGTSVKPIGDITSDRDAAAAGVFGDYRLSLLKDPNFLIVDPGGASVGPAVISLDCSGVTAEAGKPSIAILCEINELGKQHTIYGFIPEDNFSDGFILAADSEERANNLANYLRNKGYFASNFIISVDDSNAVILTGVDTSVVHDMVTLPDYEMEGWNISASPSGSDPIFGRATNPEIYIDCYIKKTDEFLASDEDPKDLDDYDYAGRLSKSYVGKKVYFDINRIMDNSLTFNFQETTGAFSPKTLQVMKLVFGISSVEKGYPCFYTKSIGLIGGYTFYKEYTELADYINTSGKFPSDKPDGTLYVPGMWEYAGLISYKDTPFSGGVTVKALDAAGTAVATGSVAGDAKQSMYSNRFIPSTVITIPPTAFFIEISMTGSTVKRTYNLGLAANHKIYQLSFLNRFGVFDAYNVGEYPVASFKKSSTPFDSSYNPLREGLVYKEYGIEIEETYTVEGEAITKAEMEWLKQLLLSPAAFDNDFRRIQITSLEFSSDSTSNFYVPILKWKLYQ
jgi:hypothetical protein